ncbi:peptide-methionine (S)-S-oxide reductase MsrA [Planctomicrobium piriforme]|uniref:Peptide methionine sulfoxide reductase MsrA n=1 Tax=Planctomicrobium piriforme TaxID=1576369 RepID=A0A1I3KRJ5_9PLAN|nr:peptide-methionine (S)-S-oxide reductase MsrA [Planctomicrobium piriforme]SFI75014.1 peptide-methionine (S)-S-oxide reductase [Planctomicrobium piriforme]
MSTTPSDSALATATFGSGCFWCTEAVFLSLAGVKSVISGYSGGPAPNPTYRQVCTGNTGHAEVIRVTFDPTVVTYPQLLEAFFFSHDPTTLNRQGNDVGTQYRSVIFYHDDEQKRQAEEIIQKLDESGAYGSPIVTEVSPLINYYPAEDYHQDYFALHGHEPYCQMVVRPKVEKFRKAFAGLLKN